jgi:hypothetical protein
MTPNKYIDLNTPEADRQPRARCSASPSHVAAEALPIDLTADTPPPVSARGIADDENGGGGGGVDVRNDFDRPPYLPRLHETRENARSNTLHSRAFAPLLAPVTNSFGLVACVLGDCAGTRYLAGSDLLLFFDRRARAPPRAHNATTEKTH